MSNRTNQPGSFPGKHVLNEDRVVTWFALIGFMGSGKSRIGWEISRRLHLNFIDTDRVIERVSGMRISEIFDTYGEHVFREYEHEIIQRTTRLDDAVISTGGGTVTRKANRDVLRARGPIVLLTASPETIYQRTRRRPRPLLDVPDPLAKIKELLTEREALYTDAADIVVNSDNRLSGDVVEEIVQKLVEWHAAGGRNA